MSSAGFRGVSAVQDSRFTNKEKQLMKSMKFPKEYEAPVDLKVIKWEAVKPWIAQRTTELLGMEDEVLISYIFEQLEGKQKIDPRELQISLTGFLEKNTSLFCKELWSNLASATANGTGVPQALLDAKAAEVQKRAEAQRLIEERIKADQRKRDEEDRKRRDEERNARREADRSRPDRDRDDRRDRDRDRHDRDRRDRREHERGGRDERDRKERDERDRRDRDRRDADRPSHRREEGRDERRDERKRPSEREREDEAERQRRRQRRTTSPTRELPGPPTQALPAPPAADAGDAVNSEPKEELVANGAAEPLEAADDLTDEARARLKAEKKAAKKEKKEKKRLKKEKKAAVKEEDGGSALGAVRVGEASGSDDSDADARKRAVEADLRQAALRSVGKDE